MEFRVQINRLTSQHDILVCLKGVHSHNQICRRIRLKCQQLWECLPKIFIYTLDPEKLYRDTANSIIVITIELRYIRVSATKPKQIIEEISQLKTR